MLKLTIRYNKIKNIWSAYLDKFLFTSLKVKELNYIKNIKIFYSKIFLKYFLLLRILRQYGLIKSIKSLKNFK